MPPLPKDEVAELARKLGGIVRNGAIYQGHAKDSILTQEAHQREVVSLRKQAAAIFLLACKENPEFTTWIDAEVYELVQNHKHCEIGDCEQCGKEERPLKRILTCAGTSSAMVCAWGCDDEENRY